MKNSLIKKVGIKIDATSPVRLQVEREREIVALKKVDGYFSDLHIFSGYQRERCVSF